MKEEISAGGVVVRTIEEKWQVLLMKDMNNTWTFPKGLIEKDETPASAAIREIAEEVGITTLTHLSELSTVEYFYRRSGLIHKTVHYFLFRFDGKEPISCQKEEGIQDAQWFSFSKAGSLVGYRKTNVRLLGKAENILSSL